MLKSLEHPFATTRLPDLGAVRVQGADAVRFLQGQLSNDVALLSPARSLLAGLHNPQGRVVALLRLISAAPDEVLVVLPRELAAPVASGLAKYVLRAKVKVADASDEWLFSGVTAVESAAASDSPAPLDLPPSIDEQATYGSSFVVRVSDAPARWLLASPAAQANAESGLSVAQSDAGSRERWRAFDIAAGIPQVCAATSGQFVAQMLNLDVVGAISFTKGCYTGQEVIARAHYRGRVKRRMQRFRTLAAARLAPGDAGTLRDGRSFRVVDAVSLADGRCEFLAVAPTSHGEPAELESAEAALHAPGAASLDAEQLSLPYELPV